MASNIEQIFRDFVMNKIREIEDEGQNSGLTSEGHLIDRVPCSVENKGPGEKVTDGTKSEGETPYQVMKCPKNSQLAKVPENTDPLKGTASKDEVETPRKKNKKHKRHKSKKKKKRRKEEKGSSSESELESDGETQKQSSAKNEVAANKEGRGIEQGNPGAGKESSRTLLIDPSGQEARRRRSKSADRSKHSKSRSPGRRKRSRSRARRSQSKRSHSSPRRRRSGFPLDRRDRWKRTPSHSPVLILRKRRSTSRPRRSSSKTPPRLTELDKDQLLEIAKANAAAMCAKAGVPVPESLRPKAILQLPLPSPVPTSSSLPLPLPINLPVNLPMGMANMPNIAMNAALATMSAALSTMSALTAMPALPTITNKPPPAAVPNAANIEEVKRKVAQKANSISIKELTEKCKKIAESKEEMAIAKPHVSDDEDDEKPFAGAGLKENKGITFSLSNSSAKPATRTEAAYAKEFPVSSGSQHRKKEGDGAYGEWVPVDKKTDKTAAAAATASEEEGKSKDSDSVFPDAPLQPVDITLAVSERAVAQKRLAENPFDVNAICMLSRAQEQVDAWAQSNTIPGLFTGSTGAQVLSSEELSTSGPQAWIKKAPSVLIRCTADDGGPRTSSCVLHLSQGVWASS
ncbi:hypothetical protein AGOR_G00064410 [Albula goreensis]|uniref:Protein SON-like n=1 Tax=Albula goreensis TaxID=1534307 RepID=A0A8T3DV37_9TELE|nr:hypothetical protein AGOR_G00064410 [Albula goreensis]